MSGKNKVLFVFGLNQGLHWFTIGLIIPVLTLLLMERGFDLAQIGIAMALMSFTVFFLELPTGGLADSIGRKRVYMISVLFNIAAYLLLLFVDSPPALIFAAFALGVGRALSSGTMDAWFIDEHRKTGCTDIVLQQNLARAGIIIPAALGGGTLIGGALPDLFGNWLKAVTPFGFYGPNLILMILLFLSQLIITAVLVREERAEFTGNIAEGFKKLPSVLGSAMTYGIRQRNTMAILLSTAALGAGLAGLEQLWQPRIRELVPETGIWVLGVISALYFLAAAGGSALSPVMLRKFGYRYSFLLFIFRLIMGALYLALSFAGGLPSFAPLYLLIFLAHGVTGSPEMTVYNRDIPNEKRSTMLSLNSLFLQGGGAFGSIIAGQMAFRLFIPAAWWLTGGLLCLSAFFYLMIKEEAHENRV